MEQDFTVSNDQTLQAQRDSLKHAGEKPSDELVQAREILDGMEPNYLAVKAKFVTQRSDGGGGGLIFLVCRKNSDRHDMLRTVFETDIEWIKSVSLLRSPESFHQLIKDYFDTHSTSMKLFDAQKLKDSIAAKLTTSSLQYLFDLGKAPKVNFNNINNPLETYMHPGAILQNLLTEVLGDVLVNRVNVDVDYDFYTEAAFAPIGQKLGLLKYVPDNQGAKSGYLLEDTIVNLKGQFTIDPVNGKETGLLKVGDKVYCEILDRSEIAVAVGKYLGAYAGGSWVPVMGTIADVNYGAAERSRFCIKISDGVVVNVMSFDGVKIKVKESGAIKSVEQHVIPDAKPPSLAPLLIAVTLLLLLIICFVIFNS